MTTGSIFERSDHVGGLASSVADPHGFIWDHGGHVMFSHYGYFDDLVEKMLGGDFDEHMREAWVWMHGRFVPYPFQNNIHRLAARRVHRLHHGHHRCSARATARRTTSTSCITAVFGEGIAQHFMRPYNFKVWAHPLEMMGTSWQGDRVPTVDVRRILQNLLDDRDDVSWGPEQQVQVPAARHRDALRAHRRVAAEARRSSAAKRRQVDTDSKVVTFSDGTSDRLRQADQHDAADRAGAVDRRSARTRCVGAPQRPASHRGTVRRDRGCRAVPEHQVLDVLPRVRLAVLPGDLPLELLAADDARAWITSRCWPRCRSRRTSPRIPTT